MEKTNQKVPFTVKNIMKCICVAYPVQGTSKSVNEKMENAKEMMKSWGGGMCQSLKMSRDCTAHRVPLRARTSIPTIVYLG
jgi:hypothetical protein